MSPKNSSGRSSSTTFHFTAGLGSGILSAVLLQPADLLKTRVQQSHSTSLIQVVREIARGPQPLRQFWRGTLPSTLRTGIGSALYFSSLNSLRQYVARSSLLAESGLVVPSTHASTTAGPAAASNHKHSSALPKLSNLANLTTGAVARASVGFVMMPITVIKVRYESNFYAYRSLFHASSDILRKEGVKGLFAGFGATAVRDAPYAGLYVLFYEQAKRRLSALVERAQGVVTSVEASAGVTAAKASEGDMKGSTSVSINFVSGVLAAGLATALTNPFDAVKTRIQLLPAEYGNMVQAARLMVKKDGFVSLLDGLGLRMARKAMSSALAWTLYEELIRRAEKRWDGKEDVL